MQHLLKYLIVSLISIVLLSCNYRATYEEEKTSFLNDLKKRTFLYFWELADKTTGQIPDRYPTRNFTSIAATGFGLTAYLVGIENNFVTREEGLRRLDQILGFLETCDRWHGVWPHWLNGNTGKVVPFSSKDDGADLVETSFMLQGLLTFRQYLVPEIASEKNFIERIEALCNSVDMGLVYPWRRCTLLALVAQYRLGSKHENSGIQRNA